MRKAILDTLAANPVLILFVVCGLGFAVGRIKLGRSKVSLGPAAVLFVGLAMGALDPRLQLPPIVNILGLVLFMYAVGLSASSGFFAAMNRGGVRDAAIACAPLLLGAVVTVALALALGVRGAPGVSLFTGSMSSSSGLAAVLDSAHQGGASSSELARATVVYSITYIDSIVGPILVILLFLKLFRIDLGEEARTLPEYQRAMAELVTASFRVTRKEAESLVVRDITQVDGRIAVVCGRVVRDGHPIIPSASLSFLIGDLVVVVGPEDELQRVTGLLGERLPEEIDHERTELELRRVFVSNPAVAGIPLSKLDLPRQLGVKLTRVRRGDDEFIPNRDTRLELGDRLRVFSQRDDLPAIRKYFGDSFTALSEVDFLSLGLGIVLGLVLGLIPIPLPGGLVLRFGFAGGPLLAGIVLAKVNRTGKIVWTLPYGANVTFRQFGLILFAAAIGTQAGSGFLDTVFNHGGLSTFAAGLAISFCVGATSLWAGYRWLKVPMNHLIGLYVGGQTQPIVLSFARGRAGNDLSATGYAAVFPIATVTKIILSELLLLFLK